MKKPKKVEDHSTSAEIKRCDLDTMKKWQDLPSGGNIIEPGSSRKNKTGSWRSQVPILDRKKCTNCMKCVNFCPEPCIMVKKGKISHIDMNYCKGCGICAQECPEGAIKMKEL